jgi:hypothetical protein
VTADSSGSITSATSGGRFLQGSVVSVLIT